MNPIRILHVFATLNRGGAETAIMTQYRKIDKTKIQFDFIVNDNQDSYHYENEVLSMGGRVFRMPRYTMINFVSYKRAWQNFLKEHAEYKILHAHYTAPAHIYFDVAKKLAIRTIAHAHTAAVKKNLKEHVRTIFMSFAIKKSDYLFACTKDAANYVFGKDIFKKDANRTKIVNNAIDTKQFVFDEEIRKYARLKLEGSDLNISNLSLSDKNIYGHIGRFHPTKNHSFIIDIFSEITKIDQKAILILIGDGLLKKDIENQVISLGLSDKVYFLGVRSDIPALLMSMDLFLFPSLFEGFGIVLIEAQAIGIPCLISNTIPKDVFLTDLVLSESLSAPANVWATKAVQLISTTSTKKTSFPQIIKDAGYDIYDTVKEIEDFYMDLYNR